MKGKIPAVALSLTAPLLDAEERNPASIKTKAVQNPKESQTFSFLFLSFVRWVCGSMTQVCEFALYKHPVGERGTVCSISDCLIPSVVSVGPAVRVPRQSCVNRGSTVVITAGCDETHCLRVTGELCQLDCTLCGGC